VRLLRSTSLLLAFCLPLMAQSGGVVGPKGVIGPKGTVSGASSSSCPSLPYTDSFTTLGALSSNWTPQTLGSGVVALAVSSSGVVQTSTNATGSFGFSIFNCMASGANTSISSTITWAGGNFSRICLNASIGTGQDTGICFVPQLANIYKIVNGSASSIASGCGSGTTGQTYTLTRSGSTYTASGTGVSCSGSDNTLTGYPGITVYDAAAGGDSIGPVTVQ